MEIGMDVRDEDNVHSGDTAELFLLLDMRQLILEKHSRQAPPETCNKNQKFKPIDGIFATRGLTAIAGGYTAYGDICPQCDHRGLWVDLTYQDCFGYVSPPHISPKQRRLQASNPELVRCYCQETKKEFQKACLFEALQFIADTAAQ